MTDEAVTDDADGPGWLNRRWAKALEGIVEDALKKLILGAVALVFAAAAAGGVVLWRETHLPPAWRGFVIFAAAVLIVGEVGAVVGTVRLAGRTRRLGLANVAQLEDDLAAAAYAQEHAAGILNTIQAMLDSEEVFGFEQFAEDAVMEPARVLLQRGPGEEVRLALLTPSDDNHFGMKWSVGHRPTSQKAFQLPMDGSVAGEVFRSGEARVIDKVSESPEFLRHPRATRTYETLVCVPVLTGDQVGGVLSVISTYEAAFTEGDLLLIETMGAVVGLVWALERDLARLYDGSGHLSG